ncbi:flagellar hook capping FlgD N-terminal domain-containing protein [Pseudomonas profundi]|uniref:flagellar hook capping FlgD N-terminal domain-containing protein n=1 Tax=Pseudomonas profundi TaxID=1981513 RepID=UPI00123A23B4|nr:flagellar hook capping FlgD N-terminal domain-containing protein [Pseudomonas profundi]
MTTITNGVQGAAGAVAGDEAPRAAVNVSDAAQLENTFITMMTAQIRNQDPTKPMDSSEFVSQFSAMSQVKSMENMAALTRNNMILTDNLQTLTAAGLVGQEVKVGVSQVNLGEAVVKGQVTQQHASGQTLIRLTDSNGTAQEFRLGGQPAGPVSFEIDPVALGLAPGRYSIEAETDTGEYPATEVAGVVRHVRVSEEGPVLDVEGAGDVPFYRITEFGQTAVAGLL